MMRGRLVTGIAVMAAVAAGAVGGALIGVPGLSAAQPFPSNGRTTVADPTNRAARPMHNSAILDAAAKALGLTTAQLRDKLSDGKTTIADVAKEQKVDVDVVIDAMTKADKDRITDIVNNPWPKFGPGTGGGLPIPPGAAGTPGAPGTPGKGFGPGLGIVGGLGRMGSDALDSVAKALGITTDELKTDLANGQSIADIAKAKKVDVDKVIDTLVGDANAKIDQAVKDGHLTKEQADKLKSMLETVISKVVNTGFPKGMHGFGGFGFGDHKGPGAPNGTPPTTKAPTP